MNFEDVELKSYPWAKILPIVGLGFSIIAFAYSKRKKK